MFFDTHAHYDDKAFDEDREASYKAGMNDHLAKPIIVTELMETLGKILFEENCMM